MVHRNTNWLSIALWTIVIALLYLSQSNAITVHLIPHTHDDVGWQVTVDQYFYGEVQYIITTVIESLLANPNRTFIYVEQAYFQRWWREQPDSVKQDVQKLVQNGQLEFINGGWCMHDEASTHFIDMVDQTTYGHSFIKSQFNKIPKVGWQIDPFGHSATQAALLSAEVGFEGLFFARIDYQDNSQREKDKTLEWIWRASPSLGQAAQVFSGKLYWGYGPPGGFSYEIGSGDLPIQDDPNLEDYNLPLIVNNFVQAAQQQAQYIQGEDIMWTMGSDFEYLAAHEWFIQLDSLIKAVNADGRVNVMYSTPSKYVEAKNKANITWTVKTDDLFPYADGEHAYWTGYFTSRPALKGYVRTSSAFLQLARQLDVFSYGAGPQNSTGALVEPLLEAMSVAQHHDAVSGTAKQAVTYDYAKRISIGAALADQNVVEPALQFLTLSSGSMNLPFQYCPLANTSLCPPTSSTKQNTNGTLVLIYNAIARARNETIRIPVDNGVTVVDANGKSVPSQVNTIVPNAASTKDSLPYEVLFTVELPPLGISSYVLMPSSSEVPENYLKQNHKKHLFLQQSNSISNDYWTVTFDSNGLVSSITDVRNKQVYNIQQNFYYYEAYGGKGQDSGAYIFRPNDTNAVPTSLGAAKLTIVQSTNNQIGSYAMQVWENWVSQVIRLNNGSPNIEFEYTIGPIPFKDGIGKEIISRFTSDISSNKTWYTDSNGREFQTRIRDYRATWPLQNTDPVTSNYYPVNAAIYLNDSSRAMSILTDRSQGGSSLTDGQVELMVHRRLLHDDGRGVGEALNETGQDPHGPGLIITGTHTLILSSAQTAPRFIRFNQNKIFFRPHQSYASLPVDMKDYFSQHRGMTSYIVTPLPLNVELMTFAALDSKSVLLRLSHSFGINEDPTYSQPAQVDLAKLFDLSVANVTEVSLTNTRPISEHINSILQWQTDEVEGEELNWIDSRGNGKLAGTVVTLNPAEIHTFVVQFNL